MRQQEVVVRSDVPLILGLFVLLAPVSAAAGWGLPRMPSLPKLPSIPHAPPLPNLPKLPSLPSLPKCGSDVCKAADGTVATVKKVGGNVVTTATKAGNDIITTTEKGGGTVVTSIQKVGGDVVTTVTDAAGGTVTTLQKASGDTLETVEKAGTDTVTTLTKKGGDVVVTVEKVNGDAISTLKKVSGATVETIRKAGDSTVTTVQKAGENTITTVQHSVDQATITIDKANSAITRNVDKGWRDVSAQSRRDFTNLVDAGTAIANFDKNEVQGVGATLSAAEKRVREGKVVDALWGLGTQPLQNTNKDAAGAVEESTVLNSVAAIAASAYGGPGGAAAYAAWLTYEETGNAELALRAGMITGATSYAFSATGQMPSGTAGELAKKVVVGGAIGGLAVAAAGGDKEAIKNAFLLSGSMILIQDQYQKVTDHPLDARASNHDGYCMASSPGEADCSPPDIAYKRDAQGNVEYETDADGNVDKTKPLVDVTKTDPRFNHVGLWSTPDDDSLAGERGDFMTAVSKVPGMNAMALFHDTWAVSWNMGMTETVSTILPATVLTYVGTGAPVYTKIQTTYVNGVQPKPQAPNGDTHAGYFCKAGAATRTITPIALDGSPGCHLIYRTETGLSTPWNARNDKSYCASKADLLADNLRNLGWSCSRP